MSDMGDLFNGYKAHKRELKERYGVPCPACTIKLPKAQPKILMPNQKCWCGYKDPRDILTGVIETAYGKEERT